MVSKKTIEMLEASASDVNLIADNPAGQWKLTARRFRGRRSGMIGLGIVLFLVFMAIPRTIDRPISPQ